MVGRNVLVFAAFSVGLTVAHIVGNLGPQRDQANAQTPTEVSFFFTNAELQQVQANPTSIVPLYAARSDELKSSLGSSFSAVNENGWKAVFATLLAHELKPYKGSTALELDDLLSEPGLDCDNYLALTYHFVQLLQPTEDFELAFVGWNGGPVGNHGQGFTTGTGEFLLIDPTVAFVAIASFDQIAMGLPIPSSKTHGSYERNDLRDFYGRVVKAVQRGYYRPSHLMYYFDDLDEYMAYASSSLGWATPQAPAP
ncbi:MAG: hypothetical protein BroJett029_23270 [Alphaproteobacteria bacterium]|nr:MAG: hypothetical protein BroJett029_23270 [Alphaproteobacteria bacterium]